MAASRSNIHLVATQYATSLYALAEEQGIASEIAKDMRGLNDMFAESADSLHALCSPIVSLEKKYTAMDGLAKGAGLNALTTQFLKTVIANGRTAILPVITNLYLKKSAEASSEVQVTIRSAKKLGKETVDALKKALESTLGKKTAIELKVDASLIAGIVIQMGSKLLDASLSGKLARLQTHLNENIANT